MQPVPEYGIITCGMQSIPAKVEQYCSSLKPQSLQRTFCSAAAPHVRIIVSSALQAVADKLSFTIVPSISASERGENDE
jgi:hypothetical protein